MLRPFLGGAGGVAAAGEPLADAVTLPPDTAAGEHELQSGILDPHADQPKVKLAIAGMEPDGWYPLGGIHVRE